MSNYAIMRCAKLKTMGGVASSLKHNFREIVTFNADSERTPENEHLEARTSSEAMGRLQELLPEKRRKDAVVAVEYLFTTSPEWVKNSSEAAQTIFFDNSIRWLREKYGAKNVITATIQRDETTPHLSAFVVPITEDGRLSAKEFIGDRGKMSADQDSFAQAVRVVGLDRGVKGSKAKHQSIKQYYAKVNQAEGLSFSSKRADQLVVDVEPRMLRKGLLMNSFEAPAVVAQRVLEKHIDPFFRAYASVKIELQSEQAKATRLARAEVKIPTNLKPDEAHKILQIASEKLRAQQKAERQNKRNISKKMK